MKTFIDTSGTEWEVEAPITSMSWNDAFDYVQSLGDNWRLPSVQELIMLVDYDTLNNVTVDNLPFKNKDLPYWTMNSFNPNKQFAWYIHFGYGYVGYADKSCHNYIRCCRHV
jgi:formylglycine-generating enzyme required for sulfatase activity